MFWKKCKDKALFRYDSVRLYFFWRPKFEDNERERIFVQTEKLSHIEKLKIFYNTPVTKFWANMVRNLFNVYRVAFKFRTCVVNTSCHNLLFKKMIGLICQKLKNSSIPDFLFIGLLMIMYFLLIYICRLFNL